MSDQPRVWHLKDPAMPKDAVYIGRPTIWGNPYKFGEYLPGAASRITRGEAVQMYRNMLGPSMRRKIRRLLKGKHLACWCKPFVGSGKKDRPCHGDVLLAIANDGGDESLLVGDLIDEPTDTRSPAQFTGAELADSSGRFQRAQSGIPVRRRWGGEGGGSPTPAVDGAGEPDRAGRAFRAVEEQLRQNMRIWDERVRRGVPTSYDIETPRWIGVARPDNLPEPTLQQGAWDPNRPVDPQVLGREPEGLRGGWAGTILNTNPMVETLGGGPRERGPRGDGGMEAREANHLFEARRFTGGERPGEFRYRVVETVPAPRLAVEPGREVFRLDPLILEDYGNDLRMMEELNRYDTTRTTPPAEGHHPAGPDPILPPTGTPTE